MDKTDVEQRLCVVTYECGCTELGISPGKFCPTHGTPAVTVIVFNDLGEYADYRNKEVENRIGLD